MQTITKMGKVIHWREDAGKMSFEDFSKVHSELFAEESELKEAYKEVTGKNPISKKLKEGDK